MKLSHLVFLSALMVAAAPVSAASRKSDHVVADTHAAFQAHAQQIRTEMSASGRFNSISSADRSAVEADLSRIEALLAEYGSVDRLPEPRKVDLINAQERANSLLTRNDGDRIICEMVEPTGSKMRQRQCRKARDIAYTRDQQRNGLQNQTRHIMNAPKDRVGMPGL